MDALFSWKQAGDRHARSLIASIALMLATIPAGGSIVDLTGGGSASGVVNGAIFEYANSAGGTGSIEPFVILRASGSEEGYNTSAPSPPFDARGGGQWTHDLLLNEIPVITLDGIDYFEFVLDVNEAGNRGKSFISLDDIKIFTSSVGAQSTTDIFSLGDLRYDFDLGEDSAVFMDGNLNSGSGQIDMTTYIPVSAFAGASATDYLYFYSEFGTTGMFGGNDYRTEGGFEEWAVQIDTNSVFIPAPGALALLALSLFTARPRRRKRMA